MGNICHWERTEGKRQVKMCQRLGSKGKSPREMCQRKGMKRSIQEKLFCRRRR